MENEWTEKLITHLSYHIRSVFWSIVHTVGIGLWHEHAILKCLGIFCRNLSNKTPKEKGSWIKEVWERLHSTCFCWSCLVHISILASAGFRGGLACRKCHPSLSFWYEIMTVGRRVSELNIRMWEQICFCLFHEFIETPFHWLEFIFQWFFQDQLVNSVFPDAWCIWKCLYHTWCLVLYNIHPSFFSHLEGFAGLVDIDRHFVDIYVVSHNTEYCYGGTWVENLILTLADGKHILHEVSFTSLMAKPAGRQKGWVGLMSKKVFPKHHQLPFKLLLFSYYFPSSLPPFLPSFFLSPLILVLWNHSFHLVSILQPLVVCFLPSGVLNHFHGYSSPLCRKPFSLQPTLKCGVGAESAWAWLCESKHIFTNTVLCVCPCSLISSTSYFCMDEWMTVLCFQDLFSWCFGEAGWRNRVNK